jgi:zinc protease
MARALFLSAAAVLAPTATAEAQQAGRLNVPVEYYKLPNGLRVVLSPDNTTPTAVVAVYYNVGFRLEPKGRTGFAHLFEHMMFQGSKNLGKLEFVKLIEQNGGVLNGSTRFDYTNYFQVVPSHTLETMLWAEADRMSGLAIDSANLANQQGVVKNEVKVNVLNQPYGGFPWLDMPQLANTNWHNAHNFYGDLAELDAASLEDVQQFFKTYYAPNNAALVVTGDFQPRQVKEWISKYFGVIPSQPQPPRPDLTEPRQTVEKRHSRTDPLAKRPALGVAYHVPERNTPEYYAFGLIDQILGQGRDSKFYQEVVQKRALAGGVNTGINYGLGNMYNYSGPMLWIASVFHDSNVSPDSIIAAMEVAIEELRSRPVDKATLDRAVVKARSALYSELESFVGFGRADLLASFALFDDDPARINRIEAEFAKVTPELIQRTAREYLRPTNRTVLTIVPAPATTTTGSSK